MLIFVLIGLPGSGKGTHASFIANAFGFHVISIGDILRKMSALDDEDGRLLRRFMGSGQIIPGNTVNLIVQKYLMQPEFTRGCVLDGYPRNLVQAEFLNTLQAQVVAIFFDVSKEMVLSRLINRFSCAKCGQIYNKSYMMPKIHNKCDICGCEEFIHRADDNQSVIETRLKAYELETLPLIDYYQKTNSLHTVNAALDIVSVQRQISEITKTYI